MWCNKTARISILAIGLLALVQCTAARKVMPHGFHERRHITPEPRMLHKRATPPSRHYNDRTAQYYVNGTTIPEVDFDIGESYAGLMPISTHANESQQLWFWYFPTRSSEAEELVIWLNGGPGCSSLEGLLQENGPFLWQYGTFRPVPNPYTWVNLTNMLWVEQPVGTGFTQGTPTARDEDDVARQFLGFLENFLTTFGLQGMKIYVTGESYAGYYVPYIVSHMYERNNTDLFDPRGLMIYDPSLTYDVIQQQIPAVPFVQHWAELFNLNDTTMAKLQSAHESCGYADYLAENLVFPPPTDGFRTPPQLETSASCKLWETIFEAVLYTNPCFNIYHVATTCPLLWDVLGFPGSFGYLPEGASVYFNRSDVQAAINAPVDRNWEECSSTDVFVDGRDLSPPSSLSVLPAVIERNERTVIAHGMLDYVLIQNGTLLAIQNMTWGGQRGFQQPPRAPFVVPWDAQGTMGRVHTERKLTYVEVELSGHMVPQYQPQSAYRQLEYLLGRIESLQ
ncbi:putative pheromone processing carboxypeptidase [Geopyxis carbonaria]|nr:putative pheromone processing carboxypeptidase [Geopyxis carbonaria]